MTAAVGGLVGVLIGVAVVLAMLTPGESSTPSRAPIPLPAVTVPVASTPAPDAPQPLGVESAAARGLARLRPDADAPLSNYERVRQRLAEFVSAHAGKPEAVEAQEFIDALDARYARAAEEALATAEDAARALTARGEYAEAIGALQSVVSRFGEGPWLEAKGRARIIAAMRLVRDREAQAPKPPAETTPRNTPNVSLRPGECAARGEKVPLERAAKAFDGATSTKWFDPDLWGRTTWIRYRVPEEGGRAMRGYAITSANDMPGRDPAAWLLRGSNDGGATWSLVDSRVGMAFESRLQRRPFGVEPAPSYEEYRFDFVARDPATAMFQVAELELLRPEDAREDVALAAGRAAFSNLPERATRYEAERAAHSGGPYLDRGGSPSGGGAIFGIDRPGASCTFEGVDGGGGGPALLTLIYGTLHQSAELALWLNGAPVETWRITPTGSWVDYSGTRRFLVLLKPGTTNQVRFVGGNGGVNLDCIDVELPAPAE